MAYFKNSVMAMTEESIAKDQPQMNSLFKKRIDDRKTAIAQEVTPNFEGHRKAEQSYHCNFLQSSLR